MAATKTKRATSTSRAKSNGRSGSTSAKSNGRSTGGRASSKSSNGRSASSERQQRPMLEELLVEQLKDIYWAEKHLLKALPKMVKAATSQQLKDALQEHISATQEQVSRCEQAFELLGQRAQGKKCDGMDGLTKEAESMVAETEKGSMTRDAGIIIAAQKVEHYEIATYGSLVQLANTIGLTEVAELLQQTLDEEKEADVLLTQIAESSINVEAEEEGTEIEEEE